MRYIAAEGKEGGTGLPGPRDTQTSRHHWEEEPCEGGGVVWEGRGHVGEGGATWEEKGLTGEPPGGTRLQGESFLRHQCEGGVLVRVG